MNTTIFTCKCKENGIYKALTCTVKVIVTSTSHSKKHDHESWVMSRDTLQWLHGSQCPCPTTPGDSLKECRSQCLSDCTSKERHRQWVWHSSSLTRASWPPLLEKVAQCNQIQAVGHQAQYGDPYFLQLVWRRMYHSQNGVSVTVLHLPQRWSVQQEQVDLKCSHHHPMVKQWEPDSGHLVQKKKQSRSRSLRVELDSMNRKHLETIITLIQLFNTRNVKFNTLNILNKTYPVKRPKPSTSERSLHQSQSLSHKLPINGEYQWHISTADLRCGLWIWKKKGRSSMVNVIPQVTSYIMTHKGLQKIVHKGLCQWSSKKGSWFLLLSRRRCVWSGCNWLNLIRQTFSWGMLQCDVISIYQFWDVTVCHLIKFRAMLESNQMPYQLTSNVWAIWKSFQFWGQGKTALRNPHVLSIDCNCCWICISACQQNKSQSHKCSSNMML